MTTVSPDPVRVESELAAGTLSCPSCGGRLAPWGWARQRPVGRGGDRRRVRPRRSICRGCRVTHVLPLTPAGHEIAGSLVALSDAGRILAGPPGMPDDIAAELRAAFAAIVTDQGFLAEAEQQGLEIAWRDHIQVERLIAAALDSPDVVRATLADAQSAD